MCVAVGLHHLVSCGGGDAAAATSVVGCASKPPRIAVRAPAGSCKLSPKILPPPSSSRRSGWDIRRTGSKLTALSVSQTRWSQASHLAAGQQIIDRGSCRGGDASESLSAGAVPPSLRGRRARVPPWRPSPALAWARNSASLAKEDVRLMDPALEILHRSWSASEIYPCGTCTPALQLMVSDGQRACGISCAAFELVAIMPMSVCPPKVFPASCGLKASSWRCRDLKNAVSFQQSPALFLFQPDNNLFMPARWSIKACRHILAQGPTSGEPTN